MSFNTRWKLVHIVLCEMLFWRWQSSFKIFFEELRSAICLSAFIYILDNKNFRFTFTCCQKEKKTWQFSHALMKITVKDKYLFKRSLFWKLFLTSLYYLILNYHLLYLQLQLVVFAIQYQLETCPLHMLYRVVKDKL